MQRLRRLSSIPQRNHYDVTIIGGGAVGSALANLISERIPSLKVSLMDARTPKTRNKALNIDGISPVLPSPRAYALSPKSLGLLGEGILEHLAASGRISYYDSMQVWESDGPAILQFSHDDLEAGDKVRFRNDVIPNDMLGAVVEDEPMVSCLWEKLRSEGEVDLISPASVKAITQPDVENDSKVEITFEGSVGTEANSANIISTNLLIAADGGNSFVRRTLGTYPTISYAYGRKALTCTVKIDSGMKNTAFQRFHPNGPIALLPIWNEDPKARQGNCGDDLYANIVWSTVPEEATLLMGLEEKKFVDKMNDLLQSGPTNAPPLISEQFKDSMPKPFKDAFNGLEYLSQSVNNGLTVSGMTERRRGFSVPPMISGVVGRRFAFDLNLMHTKNYVGQRVALVGDAAHTIHPMAGQGLNLGMADADCLVDNLKQAVESGMGIDGSAGLEYALQKYESSRQQEVLTTMGGIQFLHGVFGTTFSPAVHARSVGMTLINLSGPIRRKLVRVATGVDGIN